MYQRLVVTFLTVCAIAAGALLADRVSADELGRGISVDDWQGFGVLKGGKGYVRTPMGQLHYRDVGPRDYKYPLVLLHQSPMSMIQWAGVQNELAKMGIRSIIVDTPGYGLSDPPARQPSIRDYADNIVPLLDFLKLEKIVIGGHHTGAHISVSFAANHSDRVVGLVLHGAAQLTAAEAKAYLDNPNRQPRTPVPDGSHLTRGFNPAKPERQAILDGQTWTTIGAFMQGPDIGHWAAFHYDMLPDIAKIHVPTILLTDTKDPVNVMDKRLAGLRPDFEYVEFSNGDLLEFMADPQRWAKVVADWKATNVK
ncbi:MAG TPA: alpha/beta hydrolase [Steroidobacteraceae bacterium]|nr:alpha/beta hydrolase [Steroidobacteraceae bacterium]HRX89290.1 alpha/beta hydrolase [Steroidobacteraceae bacterium]